MVAAAAQRQREHDEARKAAGYRLGGIKTADADVPTTGWAAEQMVKRWGNSSPRKLCERAPSIFKLSFDQAYLLLEVMRGSVIAEEGAVGQRHDLLEFRQAARRLARGDQTKRLALERHIGTYYEIPAFTRVDPEIAVAVLYELMESSPRAQRT